MGRKEADISHLEETVDFGMCSSRTAVQPMYWFSMATDDYSNYQEGNAAPAAKRPVSFMPTEEMWITDSHLGMSSSADLYFRRLTKF